MTTEPAVTEAIPNPVDDVLDPKVLEDVQKAAAKLGQDYKITLSVDNASFSGNGDGVQGQASVLRAEYTATDGTSLREPIEVPLPAEQAAEMLTGYRDAFAQAANPVLSSMPDSVKAFAADRSSHVQVTGNGKLTITMDDATGNPLRATAETALTTEGVGTANSFLTVNVGRISEMAADRGIAFNGGQMMESIASGDFSFYDPKMNGLIEGSQVGVWVGINQPGKAPLSAQAYMADPAAQQNPNTMLQSSIIYADAGFTPAEGNGQPVAKLVGDIVASNSEGMQGRMIGESLEYIMGDNPVGSVTAVIQNPSVSRTGEFRAERGSLGMEFNNLNTDVNGLDVGPVIKGLVVPGIEDKMGQHIENPTVTMSLSAGPGGM
ncbi:MAG: hypothetical protein EOM26_11785 [Alphaproteobacteria bacterium]|nr:hypothetical protein [Alphaproteobacteria bacterium]